MTDSPLSFRPPMVRALLAGTKTQTRRVLNPQPPKDARYSGIHFAFDEPDSHFFNSPGGPFKVRQRIAEGDLLWVREHWRTSGSLDSIAPRNLPRTAAIFYNADRGRPIWAGRFRHGMHMPRWASRITLHVTEVRVQRLQEISEEDAIAEGCKAIRPGCYVFDQTAYDHAGLCHSSPVTAYASLWDSINGPGSWDANPWVAAYTFTVEHCNIDQARAAA